MSGIAVNQHRLGSHRPCTVWLAWQSCRQPWWRSPISAGASPVGTWPELEMRRWDVLERDVRWRLKILSSLKHREISLLSKYSLTLTLSNISKFWHAQAKALPCGENIVVLHSRFDLRMTASWRMYGILSDD